MQLPFHRKGRQANLQREDLNPIEAAMAMKQLMNDYKLTQDELAERIGKSRPAIANTLRLLNLCPEVISLVAEGKLSAGHARTIVLLPPPQQVEFANDAVKNQTSVRELLSETLIRIACPRYPEFRKCGQGRRANSSLCKFCPVIFMQQSHLIYIK